MLRLLEAIASLLGLLTKAYDRIRKRQRRNRQEDQAQDLHDDPVGFGDEFFNGVRDDDSLPGHAGRTDQANPEDLDQGRERKPEPEQEGH